MVKRITLVSAALVLVASAGLFTYEGGLPGAFLNYGPAPRSLALGKSFTGLADDVQAGYYNPAGLYQLNTHQVVLAHSQLHGARMEYIGYGLPTRDFGTVALTIINYGAEGMISRNSENLPDQPFAFGENAFMVSYAYSPWYFMSFGASAKLIAKNVAIFSGVAAGADLGVHIRPLTELSIGIQAQNILQPRLTIRSLAEIYPRTIRFGLGSNLLDDRLHLTADAVMPIIFDRDSIGNPTKSFTPQIAPHAGVEFEIVRNVLYPRFGFDLNDISVGLGVHADFGKMGIGVDYAFLLHYRSEYRLAPTHKVGLVVDYSGFRVWVDAQPRVFSPTTETNQNVLWMDVRMLTRRPVKRWQLLIKNNFGEVVRTYSGWEAPR